MLCCHRLLASGTARTAGCGVETRQERVHRASVCLRGERRSENPLEKGVLTQKRVHFIEDLIEDTKQGHPHEQNETRCFKSVGMGLFDVRTAQLIYEKALDKGIGQKLNF